jgi:hypothetical protein
MRQKLRVKRHAVTQPPDSSYVWKIGLWEFTRTSDGEAFWEWTGPVKSEQYQESNRTSHRARGPAKERVAEAKSVPETPAGRVLRRSEVPRLPSGARVAKPNVWRVFEP